MFQRKLCAAFNIGEEEGNSARWMNYVHNYSSKGDLGVFRQTNGLKTQ
jgi:hypothetical protein